MRYREYRLLWWAQLFSGMGSWMDQVTRSWLIHELTDSAVRLGMVRGVQAIAYLLFSPSLAAMASAGLFHVYSNALVQTVVQSYTPLEFRGRTMALFNMHQIAITLGAMLVGALASIAGPRHAMALMGAAGAISMIALHFAMPKTRHISADK